MMGGPSPINEGVPVGKTSRQEPDYQIFEIVGYRTAAMALSVAQRYSDTYPEADDLLDHPLAHAPMKVQFGQLELWVPRVKLPSDTDPSLVPKSIGNYMGQPVKHAIWNENVTPNEGS